GTLPSFFLRFLPHHKYSGTDWRFLPCRRFPQRGLHIPRSRFPSLFRIPLHFHFPAESIHNSHPAVSVCPPCVCIYTSTSSGGITSLLFPPHKDCLPGYTTEASDNPSPTVLTDASLHLFHNPALLRLLFRSQ